MRQIVVGVDLSMTQTGICIRDGVSFTTHPIKLKGKEKKYSVYQRAEITFCRMMELLEPYGRDTEVHMFIEGYAMGARGSRVFSIGEFGGVFKFLVLKEDFFVNPIQAYSIPPTSMKKYITGKGNAEKEEVRDALLGCCPMLAYTEDLSLDESDACGLCVMGSSYIFLGEHDKPKDLQSIAKLPY